MLLMLHRGFCLIQGIEVYKFYTREGSQIKWMVIIPTAMLTRIWNLGSGILHLIR